MFSDQVIMTINFWTGVVVGIGTNLLAWWILFHLIVPKVNFSLSIQKKRVKKTKAENSGSRYRVKIENTGKRTVIDVEVSAKILIKGIGKTKSLWSVIPIPLNHFGEFVHKFQSIHPSIKGKRGKRKILAFEINSRDDLLDRPGFPKKLNQKNRKRKLTLEELLTQGLSAYLVINLFGYDEFSGTRKHFVSKRYRLADVKEGEFSVRGLEILDEDSQRISIDSPEGK